MHCMRGAKNRKYIWVSTSVVCLFFTCKSGVVEQTFGVLCLLTSVMNVG